MTDYYTLLQLPPGASAASVRKAYRRLAKTCHPDLHPDNPEASRQFIALTEAYLALSTPHARQSRDMPSGSEFGMPPRQPSEEDITRFYRDLKTAYDRSFEPVWDFEKVMLAVFMSPITYCLLIVFFMLLAFQEGLNGASHLKQLP